ncbi:MAG: hypothetical protein HQK60_12595 [Deltaproteobacteria bacterium]|nr:hypothetical protein [Deltaproteobacteria bacterium]
MSDVMDFFGLTKDLRSVGYFETNQDQQVFKDVKKAIKMGRLVAVSGMVGCGKTTAMRRLQETLEQESLLQNSSRGFFLT